MKPYPKAIVGLAVLPFLFGCTGKEAVAENNSAYYFDRFGSYNYSRVHPKYLCSGDFDGDGDIDIAFSDGSHGYLIILENKMPQKTSEKTE